ncbi:MAG TPA: 4-(cytidine 5'-diphospho)-2-C-methyl-D-erythritol kinase [Puia sp.]
MVFFPNCKINLGLKVLRRRGDGFHDLETIFYPLAVRDVLEIVRSEQLEFTSTGLPIPGDSENNLCLRAYHLLKKDFPLLSPVHIYLHKHIPIGAGLGGGSSDGATMLRLLNASFHLQLPDEKLLEYAAQLGSDCPFFILNKPCLAGGRGEKLAPIELDLEGYSFAIVHPGVHISTAWAFAQCIPHAGGKPVEAIIRQPVDTWAAELINDFEKPILQSYPELKTLKEQLYSQGALYASMTGSGSSFFGIFEKGQLPSLTFDPKYQVILLT